jgi:hypothetical protein
VLVGIEAICDGVLREVVPVTKKDVGTTRDITCYGNVVHVTSNVL